MEEIRLKLGFIGLGKMGRNIVEHALEKKHEIIVFNRTQSKMADVVKLGATPSSSHKELCTKLAKTKNDNKIIWLMVSAGDAVDEQLKQLLPHLSKGDVVVDGGNSHYKDSMRRAEELKKKGVFLLDIGTSGGLDGARRGACFMAGGEKEAFAKIEPLLKDLAVKGGYALLGASGAGHFSKMVHNAIEYGMMQAIGEGFELLEKSGFDYDNKRVAELWNSGSVIRSWLVELAGKAFGKDAKLDGLEGVVFDSGEGKWSLEYALEKQASVPVIAAALFARYKSRDEKRFSERVVAALRREFGGHEVKGKEKK